MREELLKGLTEEQIKKLKECKNSEEMLALAKEEGLELTDEQLEAVTGGACVDLICPVCAAPLSGYIKDDGMLYYECDYCGHKWSEVDD